jgi:hypothetical protein
MLGALYLTEYINRRNNGVVLAPWELVELPDEWIELYKALQKAAGKKQEEDKHAQVRERLRREFENQHPHYRKS